MATNRIFKFMLFCVICMASFQSSHAIITIKVSDTTGSPVANALVTLTNERDTTRTHYSNTDRSGLCTIDFAALAVNEQLPKPFSLGQNYPNPFNPTTIISYQLPVSSNVTLKIFDILGREVATIVDEFRKAGYYKEVWDASNYASGVYFYKIAYNKFTSIKKLAVVK